MLQTIGKVLKFLILVYTCCEIISHTAIVSGKPLEKGDYEDNNEKGEGEAIYLTRRIHEVNTSLGRTGSLNPILAWLGLADCYGYGRCLFGSSYAAPNPPPRVPLQYYPPEPATEICQEEYSFVYDEFIEICYPVYNDELSY